MTEDTLPVCLDRAPPTARAVELGELPGPSTPALFNTLEYVLAPRQFARRNAERFGRVYVARGIAGKVVFTAHPEHIRRIFAADFDTFDSFAAVSFRGLFGPRSVTLTAGRVHKRQRKLLAPPMQGARLRAFGGIMQQVADDQLSSLQPGQRFRALELSTRFTLDVIMQTVFGANTRDERNELQELLTALVDYVPPLAVFAPRLQAPWFRPWARLVRARERFDRWLRRKIAERRRSGGSGEDVLSLLLQARYEDGSCIDESEIGQQLVTLLLVGHETTSIALASCLARIHRNPDVLARLLAELDAAPGSVDSVQSLPYLSAVIDETLRIDPVITEVARVPRAEFSLGGGLTVGPSHILAVLIEALHQDPALYPDPGRFRPERFLERTFAPHEYAPYGGGVRRCLGAAFSDYETKIMLASMLRRFRFELTGPKLEWRARRNLTMGPSRGVPMRVVARRP